MLPSACYTNAYDLHLSNILSGLINLIEVFCSNSHYTITVASGIPFPRSPRYHICCYYLCSCPGLGRNRRASLSPSLGRLAVPFIRSLLDLISWHSNGFPVILSRGRILYHVQNLTVFHQIQTVSRENFTEMLQITTEASSHTWWP
jgi:hypothetical protein